MKRASGVLMHISSLPSKYGIGTLGKAAYDFVDFLSNGGQSYWQILPIGPTSYGDSPYAGYSTFAGNPYFIDLDLLAKDGLLKPEDYQDIKWFNVNTEVDFGLIYNNRFKVLNKATKKFLENPAVDYKQFCEDNKEWLDDYCLFMSLKGANGGQSWQLWPTYHKMAEEDVIEVFVKEHKEEIENWKVIQYFFFKQWFELKKYANEKGIQIIGDIPIYVALDSADVWSNSEMFQLDELRAPTNVAGCPPDAFSDDGQLWGNPLYDWDKLKENGYKWWIERIEHLSKVFDIIRIDHFRGFAGYYSIAAGEKTGKNGKWMPGPGYELFAEIKEQLGELPIIVEDLGVITEDVRELLDAVGYPGMKVLEFAFNKDDNGSNEYLPHNFIKNSVGYLGTHDNDTITGWLNDANPDSVRECLTYLDIKEKKDFNWHMIKVLMATIADTVVVTGQDLLGLDNKARMNVPSTAGTNWKWRAKPNDFNGLLAKKLYFYTRKYGRSAKN